jgi:hypothetical protein
VRNELCLDNRNEPKWSVALNAADRVNACALVYAAMLFQDVFEHGNQMHPWVGHAGQVPVRDDVRRFFLAERERSANGQAKDLWRIANLDARIKLIETPYNWDQQAQYVEGVLRAMDEHRVDERPVAVLFDPCNGIANTRHHDHPHFRIHSETISTLWEGLRQGDVLVIWQWPQPERIPAHNPIHLLDAAIRAVNVPVPIGGIQVKPFGPFAMLELVK